MIHYNPPHETRDQSKLGSMIAAIESGKSLPPIVVMGYDAFTGSHRIAAWEACNVAADVVEITDDDYIAAMTEMGLDWECDSVYDYNEFCGALYKVTADSDIKAAIKDQRG